MTKVPPTPEDMIIVTWIILKAWLVEGDQEKVYREYLALTLFERDMFLGALQEVISESDNAEFRQAAKDIPAFIKSKL